ncbi:MAG: hypothetical protein MI922_04350, partial [Bacteroidales bacterium]|nr:hypothetical protein [Bacteroidales bacterium]
RVESKKNEHEDEERPGALAAAVESLNSIELSLGASAYQKRVTAMTEKAGNIQNMMQALKKIKEGIQGMTDFANEMSGTELTAEGSNQLFSYMTNVRQQLRAFVRMMAAHSLHERELKGEVVGLAAGFRADDVMHVDPQEEDLTTPEGIEKYLESMRNRLESLSSYEGYLKEQERLLVTETNQMDQDIVSVMKGNGELNKALAMDLANLASSQLLKGFDILLGLDGERQKSRVAKLLEMEIQQTASYCCL